MGSVLHDLRFASRQLLKHRGFSLIAVLTLALGIGANTAVFSVVNSVLLRPLPWPESDRVLSLWEGSKSKGHTKTPMAPLQFMDLRRDAKSFEALAGWNTTAINLVSEGTPPVRHQGAAVTEDFFRVMRVAPLLGTGFREEQFTAGKDGVVLIGHAIWQERFGGAPDIVGRTVRINGKVRSILGVMPPAFQSPAKAQFWVPRLFSGLEREDRDYKALQVLGRLAPGVSVEQAVTELHALYGGLRQLYPEVLTGWDVTAHPALEDLAGPLRPTLWMLFAAVATVLLLACLNVANLSLARGAGRLGELSVRAALGAGRGVLLRQLLLESLLLAALGGLVGLLLGRGLLVGLLALAPANLPRLDQITLDGEAFAFTAAACMVTGVLFGIVPAWRLSAVNPLDALRKSGSWATASSGWLRPSLVVVQVGAAMTVLVATGLLLRSFDRVLRQDLGFNPAQLMTVRLELSPAKYGAEGRRDQFAEEVLRRLSETPGMDGAAVSTFLPFQGWPQFIMRLEESPDVQISHAPATGYQGVSPDYFRVMQMTLLQGRGLTDQDREATRKVAVVNQTFARRFFGTRDPIGQRFEVGITDPPNWLEIVGVVADAKGQSLEAQPDQQVFVPLRQQAEFLRDNPAISVIVRGRGDPTQLAEGLRQAVWAIDKDQPLHLLQPMTQVIDGQAAYRRFTVTVLSVFAGAAVLLAALGLYGVTSSGVVARTRELGIRLALGAPRASVRWLILLGGLRLVAGGVLLGMFGSFASTRLLQSLLFQVKALDLATYGAVPLLLLTIALAACWLPARRATRINPSDALRSE